MVNLDNVFLFNETPSTILESQDKTAKEIIIKGLDNFFPNFVKLLSSEKWFGSFVHVEPISATKEYFVFDLPKYFKHLLLVNQIQVGTDSSHKKYNYLKLELKHPNILQLDSYWLEQSVDEDITRIITNTKYCRKGSLETYINSLNKRNRFINCIVRIP